MSTTGGGQLDAGAHLGIKVSANIQGLSAGQYTGSVNSTVTHANGVTTTQQVLVNLTILQPSPCIVVSPTTLSFTAEQGGSSPGAQSFTVTNCGDAGTVTAGINGASWLSSDKGGTLGSPGQLSIDVSVNTQGLSRGQYTGSVAVTLTDGRGATTTSQVRVNLTVTPACTLSVNPSALSFTAEQGVNTPAPQSFTVISNCSATVTTSVSTNSGGSWLNADNRGQVDSSNPLGINVSVNVQGLSAGSYAGSVNVTFKDANGATTTNSVDVSLYVTPRSLSMTLPKESRKVETMALLTTKPLNRRINLPLPYSSA